MSVFQDSSFTDPGATTTDAVSGSTTLTSSGSVNTAVVGAYTLTYVTHDTTNNYATSTRTVNVLISSVTLTTTANGNGTLSATTSSATIASTTSSGVVTTLTIPTETVITGASTWNSKIIFPVATTTYTLTANSGYTASAVSITEMGAGDTALTLSQAVQIVFTGQTGKLVGWSQSGSFHQITSICTSTTTPTLSVGADCKIESDSDLMVWTKHLTTFILYTETLIPVSSPSSSSSSSGGGGISTSVSVTPTVVAPVVASSTPTSPIATVTPTVMTSTAGQVLGTQTYFFTKSLALGSENSEVTELQNFLTKNKFYSGPITGYFGLLTKVAVSKFQKSRSIEALGTIGPLTRAELNKDAPLSSIKKSSSPVVQVEPSKKVAVPIKETTTPVVKKESKKVSPLPNTNISTSTKKTIVVPNKKVLSAEKVLGVTVYNFTKDLALDSQGPDVIALQLFLMDNKLYTGQITGHFGSLTGLAVSKFQKAHGLAPTGIVDAPTRVQLHKGI